MGARLSRRRRPHPAACGRRYRANVRGGRRIDGDGGTLDVVVQCRTTRSGRHVVYPRCAKAWDTEGDREFGDFRRGHRTKMLGCVGINQINRINRFANMGYWVRSSRGSAGSRTTAARLASGFAFEASGSRESRSLCCRTTSQAGRVAEKIGARFECIARNRSAVRDAKRTTPPCIRWCRRPVRRGPIEGAPFASAPGRE